MPVQAAPELAVVLADIERLVACESPSDDRAAVARSADAVAALGERLLGVAPERVVIDGRTHLRWRLGDGPAAVLVLGHHDTVWPIGTLGRLPSGVGDGVLRGPGCFDMKTGVVMALHAVAALPDRAGVTILLTGDEELGSPSSRQLIEDEARGCRAAFVLEAAADGGHLKTARKGVSLYRVHVSGRAAHAGLEPERGVNAAVEAAQLLLAVAALDDPGRGTSVTPTLLTAGTTTNTVPAAAEFAVDVRAWTVAEQQRVDAALHALTPRRDGATVRIEGGPNRPPLEAALSAELFARASAIAASAGLTPFDGVAVGGASDGNFTAGIGVPTLDGLGAVGGGAHADDEHVLVALIPERLLLLERLLQEQLAAATPGEGR
ncbi:M20/M25/M40 family metallo-hydrolase [Microbacterium sp. BLY]|uniref:M20/M25/M40 family metallo-hydrolase n=1 Tax=Microbacterium sp. BLY TaxID=2823280 RepID=UPI001B33BF39|nr:M20/M25/M40 family metallo-hydrolase [Microbacterium sp. BLY]MBP3978954.1 M20/M25/M40 family metallo-hydrolase [Microbacterium sp. BLY]